MRVGDGLRLRAVQCVDVKGSQAADLFPKLSGAAFGVAVTGDSPSLLSISPSACSARLMLSRTP